MQRGVWARTLSEDESSGEEARREARAREAQQAVEDFKVRGAALAERVAQLCQELKRRERDGRTEIEGQLWALCVWVAQEMTKWSELVAVANAGLMDAEEGLKELRDRLHAAKRRRREAREADEQLREQVRAHETALQEVQREARRTAEEAQKLLSAVAAQHQEALQRLEQAQAQRASAQSEAQRLGAAIAAADEAFAAQYSELARQIASCQQQTAQAKKTLAAHQQRAYELRLALESTHCSIGKADSLLAMLDNLDRAFRE